MKNIEILSSVNEMDMRAILEVWESSVRATHSFLREEDIVAIKPQVSEGVRFVSSFACVRDKEDVIQAFMGVHEHKIEMLFVRDEHRAKGLGKMLVLYAIEKLAVKFVDVNEDNAQAVGFYEHMGFEVFKRSELDSHGDPFPILHMELN